MYAFELKDGVRTDILYRLDIGMTTFNHSALKYVHQDISEFFEQQEYQGNVLFFLCVLVHHQSAFFDPLAIDRVE